MAARQTRTAEYEGYVGAIHKALATSRRGAMDRSDPGYKSPKRKYTGISRGKARGSTPGGKRNG